MKRLFFAFALLGIHCFLSAQTVNLNTTFGTDGQVETGLFLLSGAPYGLDLAALPDGEIVIAGGYTNLKALKYDAKGILQPDFSETDISVNTHTVGLSVQKNGKILLAAEDTSNTQTLVARLNIDGSLDETFGKSGIVQIEANFSLHFNVFEQSDGKIILYGMRYMGMNNYVFSAIRLLANGEIDNGFGNNGAAIVDLPGVKLESALSSIEQPDHKLLFAGAAILNGWKIMLLRLHPDGSLDKTFGVNGAIIDPVNGNSESYAIALQPDGKILLGGYTMPDYQAIVVRYDNEGARDESFALNGIHYFPETQEIIGLAVKPDGKILSAHWENTEDDNIALAQLLANGARDESFGVQGVYKIESAYARPKAFVLRENCATISAVRDHHKVLFSVVFDLNLGMLTPSAPRLAPTVLVYPNPLGEAFTLKFALEENQSLSARMYDQLGKLVENLFENQVFKAGEHTLNLVCPPKLPAGSYVLAVEINGKKIAAVRLNK